MAVEAVSQMHHAAENAKPITGYRLRDITIKTALVIPDNDDGVEVLLNMRSIGIENGSDWFAFSVKSINNGAWTEHSSGCVTAVTEGTYNRFKTFSRLD